ncbi:hypothetical protein IMY05_008G0028200 [Salix suchowensis]|nr:hypothetical protein IMY05_008G0028200 [Salix suchowensis]
MLVHHYSPSCNGQYIGYSSYTVDKTERDNVIIGEGGSWLVKKNIESSKGKEKKKKIVAYLGVKNLNKVPVRKICAST